MKVSKRLVFTLLNATIVIWEICSLVLRIAHKEQNMFLFFTVQSNVVAMVVCAVSVALAIKNKTNVTLYLWSSCLVAFTLVVMLVGASTVEGGYRAMFLEGECLLNHLACPIVMLANYLFFAPKDDNLDGAWWAIATILCYGTTMYLLNAFGVVVGPYFFFEVHSMSLGKVLAMLVTLVALSALTSFTVFSLKPYDKATVVAK